jgi:glutathione S-transferase
MSFTVIGAPLSPFVRKVHITMQLKNIEFTMEPVSPFALPEGYEKINPVKRIPVLKHDDTYICDSAVICQYLEDLCPEPQLIPQAPLAKARVAWFEKLADTELAPAIAATAFRHRVIYRAMGKPFDEAEIDAIIEEKAPPLYDYLNEAIGSSDFLVGEQFSLADIAVITQFINASLGGELVDDQRWPNLGRYVAMHFASETFAPSIASAQKMVGKMLAAAS